MQKSKVHTLFDYTHKLINAKNHIRFLTIYLENKIKSTFSWPGPYTSVKGNFLKGENIVNCKNTTVCTAR